MWTLYSLIEKGDEVSCNTTRKVKGDNPRAASEKRVAAAEARVEAAEGKLGAAEAALSDASARVIELGRSRDAALAERDEARAAALRAGKG